MSDSLHEMKIRLISDENANRKKEKNINAFF